MVGNIAPSDEKPCKFCRMLGLKSALFVRWVFHEVCSKIVKIIKYGIAVFLGLMCGILIQIPKASAFHCVGGYLLTSDDVSDFMFGAKCALYSFLLFFLGLGYKYVTDRPLLDMNYTDKSKFIFVVSWMFVAFSTGLLGVQLHILGSTTETSIVIAISCSLILPVLTGTPPKSSPPVSLVASDKPENGEE